MSTSKYDGEDLKYIIRYLIQLDYGFVFCQAVPKNTNIRKFIKTLRLKKFLPRLFKQHNPVAPDDETEQILALEPTMMAVTPIIDFEV
jgi:hypothetical protein